MISVPSAERITAPPSRLLTYTHVEVVVSLCAAGEEILPLSFCGILLLCLRTLTCPALERSIETSQGFGLLLVLLVKTVWVVPLEGQCGVKVHGSVSESRVVPPACRVARSYCQTQGFPLSSQTESARPTIAGKMRWFC